MSKKIHPKVQSKEIFKAIREFAQRDPARKRTLDRIKDDYRKKLKEDGWQEAEIEEFLEYLLQNADKEYLCAINGEYFFIKSMIKVREKIKTQWNKAKPNDRGAIKRTDTAKNALYVQGTNTGRRGGYFKQSYSREAIRIKTYRY